MSTSMSIHTLFFLCLLTMLVGCNSSADKLKELQSRHEEMKTISGEFLEVLSSVNDEASAKKALPLLKASCEKMFAAGQRLDEAAKTTLRSAASLKQEIENFRREQKSKVDEQIQRIGQIPEAVAVLEPLLKEYGMF